MAVGWGGGVRLIALGLAALAPLAVDVEPLGSMGSAAAQTEDVVGPEHDAFMAALEQLEAVTRMVEPEPRLAALRAVQVTLHRLAAEYPDSLAWAVLGRSLNAGLHPAAEMEQQIAGILAIVDQGVALHEANRAEREERCPSMPEACALIADGQATAEAIRIDGSSGRGTAGEQRFTALVAIAAAQVAMGLREEAQLSLGDALVAAPEIEDVQLAAEFARVLALTGDLENARRSFAYATELVLPDAGFQTVMQLDAIAVAQAGAGLSEDAARTFAAALAVQDGLGRTMVVAAQVEAGLYADAGATAAGIANPSGRAAVLADIAAAQAAAGAEEDARQTLAAADAAVADAAAEDPQRAVALSRLAHAQVALGLADAARATLADALAAAAQTPEPAARLTALIEVGSVRTGAGMHDEAGRALRDAAVEALAFEDVAARVRFLARIAGLQAEAGFVDDARRTFSDASAVAAGIEGYQHLFSMAAIAGGQAEAGLFDDAFATAAALQDVSAGDVSYVLEIIAAAQAAAGRFADARSTADRMPAEEGEPSDSYYRALAEMAKAQAAAAEAALAAE